MSEAAILMLLFLGVSVISPGGSFVSDLSSVLFVGVEMKNGECVP